MFFISPRCLQWDEESWDFILGMEWNVIDDSTWSFKQIQMLDFYRKGEKGNWKDMFIYTFIFTASIQTTKQKHFQI